MTVGVFADRGSIEAATASRTIPAGALTDRTPGFGKTLVTAMAVMAIAEVVLLRIAAPVLSHVPSVPGGSGLTEAVRAAGASAMGATAVLAPLVILSLAAAAMRQNRIVAWLLIGSVAVTAIETFWDHPAVATSALVITMVTALGLAAASLRSDTGTHAIGVGLLAGAFIAGRFSLIVDDFPGRVTNASVAGQTMAELLLVAAIVAMALNLVFAGISSRWALWVSLGMGLGSALVLQAGPGHAAILSLWSTGITLSLPALAYVFAAAAFGLIVTEWLGFASSRLLAAGLVLVVLAGITPTVLHHNLTALAGLVLVAQGHSNPRAALAPDGKVLDG